jgi:hypothetical protein
MVTGRLSATVKHRESDSDPLGIWARVRYNIHPPINANTLYNITLRVDDIWIYRRFIRFKRGGISIASLLPFSCHV